MAEDFHGPKDYLDAAQDSSASPEQLRDLARSPYTFVDVAVARHPRAPADCLVYLFSKVETGAAHRADLLHALALHPNASQDLLEAIAELVPGLLHVRDLHEAFAVGVALSRRPEIGFETLERLLSSPQATTEFRKVIARETTRADVVTMLRSDRSERVRRAAGTNEGA